MCLHAAPVCVIVTAGRLTQTWEHKSFADFSILCTGFDLYAAQSMNLLHRARIRLRTAAEARPRMFNVTDGDCKSSFNVSAGRSRPKTDARARLHKR